jgi:hypothetical protein
MFSSYTTFVTVSKGLRELVMMNNLYVLPTIIHISLNIPACDIASFLPSYFTGNLENINYNNYQ